MKEPAKIANPEYSVDKIVARMQEAAAGKGQFQDFASSEVVTSAEFRPTRTNGQPLAEIDIQPFTLQPSFQAHRDGKYHVNDLLKYHDRNFIQNAYRAILKRGPDASGYKGFIESLRSGRLNKVDILARLRYSVEGRAKKVEIEGLRTPAIIRMAYRVPVLGYLLNLGVAFVRLPMMIRSEQQFEGHMLAQQELVADQLNHLGRTLRAHSGEVSQVLAQQNQSIKALGDQLNQQLDEVRHRLDRFTTHLDEESTRRGQAEGRLAAAIGLWEQEIRVLSEKLAKWDVGLKTFQIRALQWRSEIAAAETELRQTNTVLQERLEVTGKSLKREVETIFEKQQAVTTELAHQQQRVTTLLTEARKRLPAPFDEAQLTALSKEGEHALDAFYASFDEQFRGRRDEIKQRLKVYLPIIKKGGIGGKAMPVLDVGCGRGEWLELLQEEQLEASGVDSNRVLAEDCRVRGLKVIEEDLISHLRGLADNSLGAVTGFHIVEHLPLETLIEFLNETVRVLKPRGVVIFETPNPQNVLVGSCNFYFDPTHRNPVPSQVLNFLLESRGFVAIEILKLNPSDDTPVADDSDLARRFNQYFYGPMDYAAIGYRP